MHAPILFQVNKWRLINYSKWPIYKGKLNSPHDILYTTLLGKIQDSGFIRAFLFSFWTPVKWQSTHSRSNISMVGPLKMLTKKQPIIKQPYADAIKLIIHSTAKACKKISDINPWLRTQDQSDAMHPVQIYFLSQDIMQQKVLTWC